MAGGRWAACMPGRHVGFKSTTDQSLSNRETDLLHGTDWPRFQVYFINPCFRNCPLTDSIVLSNYVEIICQNSTLGSVPQGDGCATCQARLLTQCSLQSGSCFPFINLKNYILPWELGGLETSLADHKCVPFHLSIRPPLNLFTAGGEIVNRL